MRGSVLCEARLGGGDGDAQHRADDAPVLENLIHQAPHGIYRDGKPHARGRALACGAGAGWAGGEWVGAVGEREQG